VEALERVPSHVMAHRLLASCYAHMGRVVEAQKVVDRLRAITPVVVPSYTPYRNVEHRELFLSGLRLAVGETGPVVAQRRSKGSVPYRGRDRPLKRS
jgi:hypothetical protein